MASKLGDLYVNVSSKGVTGVNQGLTQVDKKAQLAAKATNLLKMALIGIGVVGVLRGLKSIISAYVVQEKALAKLTQQLKNHNELTDKNVRALQNQAKALQEVTVFGDEQIIAAQAMLASFGLTTEQLIQMTPRMLDVAVMTENTTGQMQDLATTAKMVGVALSGQPGRLAQMGIKLSDYEKKLYTAANEQEKFNLLLQIFDNNAKGLAESIGKTLAGSLKQLENQFGDLKESAATILLPTMRGIIKVLTTAAKGWNELLSGNAQAIEQQNEMIATALARYKQWLKDGTMTLEQYHIAIQKLMQLNTGFIAQFDPSKLPSEPLKPFEITAEMHRQYQEMIELAEALIERRTILTQATGELTDAEIELINAQILANQEAREAARIAGEETLQNLQQQAYMVQSYFMPTLYSLYGALAEGGNVWKNFANAAVDALKRIMVQMMAMATMAAILNALFPGLGGFGKIFTSMMGFQSPRGDWWAQKEGRDFGKFFMDGFQTSFMPMVQGVNTVRQQQEPLMIYAEPGIIVEKLSNMGPTYKSKLYRKVTIPGRALEG